MNRASADAEQFLVSPSMGTVLVVDDEEANRLLLQKALRGDGYVVKDAADGEQGLEMMRACAPDVILLDLVLPDMSGYDVLRAKAVDPALAAIPVLVLTAVSEVSVKVEGLELGASDYLTKPFSLPELRARVRNLVRLRWQEVELTRLTAQLARQAASDSLTGLANRRGFDAYWRREVSRAQRYRTPIALVLFDIDHFKRVNDTHGHQVGDAVLAGVSKILASNVRESDLLARFGGEEFALVLPNADEHAAAQAAEKLRALVSSQVVPPLTTACTLSAGIASSVSTPVDKLIDAADAALYGAKRSGRDCVCAASALQSESVIADVPRST